jgi:hypothetical protein
MVFLILALWGCMPEITGGCMDMTNASSTYLSIVLGAVFGGLISWWVYKIEKKTTRQIIVSQDFQLICVEHTIYFTALS